MKLLTLNCHSWQEKNQIQKIKYLADIIVEEEYEVIALQEVNQLLEDKIVCSNIKNSNFAYILCRELKERGVAYSFNWDYHHIGYSTFEEGTSFLYRGEIKEFITDFVGKCRDTNFWKTRKFSMISKIVSGEIIDFYNLHLGWWNDSENSFQNQVHDLLEFSNKRCNKSFFMGDFNNDANVRGEAFNS
ncbi:MAG: endonuclease/exonuclease/phosphatase family protein [Fusobacteriaceae bacterium]